jgi:uroporphyrinogen-III decarboxylase
MNYKERIYRTFRGEKTERIPVCPHWWGVYKFELARASGLLDETQGRTPDLAQIDANFYETFKPDWFHLGAGEWKRIPNEEREKNKKDILPELRKLDNQSIVDEYLDLNRYSEREIIETGTYDHVKTIVKNYGETVFIALNEGNPICEILDPHGIIGFERGLIALVEKPDLMKQLIFGLYERKLDWMSVLAKTGCHAYIGSETYASADIISPDVYSRLVFPAQKFFYEKIRTLGMEPIVYFCGDVRPLIPYINELDVTALLIEEGKKNFTLDVKEIRRKLASRITLFGNLDSVHTLLFGSAEDVRRETIRQLEAARLGPFVMANGSPIAPGTSKENLKEMIQVSRSIQ